MRAQLSPSIRRRRRHKSTFCDRDRRCARPKLFAPESAIGAVRRCADYRVRSRPVMATLAAWRTGGQARAHPASPTRRGRRRRAELRKRALTDAPGGSPGAVGHKSGAREDTRGPAGCGVMGCQESAGEAARERSDCAVTALESTDTAPPQVSDGATGESACRPGSVHPRERGPAAIHLGLPLPAASCGLPASSGGPPSDTRAGSPAETSEPS